MIQKELLGLKRLCTQAVPFCTTRGSSCVVANLRWALNAFLKCGWKVWNEWIAGKMWKAKIVLTVSREGGTQNTVMKRKGLNFKIWKLLLAYIITDFHSQSTTLLLCLYLRILIYLFCFPPSLQLCLKIFCIKQR